MTDLEQKIHDFVRNSAYPVSPNQIFQGLKDEGMDVTMDKVLRATESLVEKGFLVDSGVVSYFAIG